MFANCYLSPGGKFYYGLSHLDVANKILEKAYGFNKDIVTTEYVSKMVSLYWAYHFLIIFDFCYVQNDKSPPTPLYQEESSLS